MLNQTPVLEAPSKTLAASGLLSGTTAIGVGTVVNRNAVSHTLESHTTPRDACCMGYTSGSNEIQYIRVLPQDIRLTQHPAYDRIMDKPCPRKDYTEEWLALNKNYMVLDARPTVIELLEAEPTLYDLLIEAVEPLRQAFGDKRLMYLRVQSSDEDSIAKVAVQLPASFAGDPERALRSFHIQWWLKNCHRSGAALVFDYETNDAV